MSAPLVPTQRHPPKRLGRWLPKSPAGLIRWVQGIVKKAKDNPPTETPCSVDKLRELIEGSTELRMLASAMLTEVPNKCPYVDDPIGNATIRTWDDMLLTFARIIDEPVVPAWSETEYEVGLIGFPFNAVLDWPMATPSGYAFFLRADVNERFKCILNEWRDEVLTKSVSQSVLTTNPGGWLSPEALKAIEKDTNVDGVDRKFQDLFECDPEGDPDHWGFKSWDDFFVRKFKDMDTIRPVEHPDDVHWIANACEAQPFALQHNIQEKDSFWLKGQPYSVAEVFKGQTDLTGKPFSDRFVGGIAYQAFLSATSYHRWSSPVSGKVVHTDIIEGTYFSEPTITGFSNPDGPDPAAPDQAQGYITHVATRAVIFIYVGPPIGLVGVVFIGMADVSTCEFLEKFKKISEPKSVEKGEELGMFHHGGSTHVIFLQPGLKAAFKAEATPTPHQGNIPIRSDLAYVEGSEEN